MRIETLNYLIDAKRPLAADIAAGVRWDVFISAYNDSGRVQEVFKAFPARNRVWWALPEYGYQATELPTGFPLVSSTHFNEEEMIVDCLARSGVSAGFGGRLCIDITGFMRPHILFFLKYLKNIGITSFDMIYTEPEHYSRKAETKFSLDDVSMVRQVVGYEGQHTPDMSDDILLVGVGYDHNLIARVILAKESALLIQLHAFPSLSADMYHESILRLDRVSSASRIANDQIYFSSANDPYVTAAELSNAYADLVGRRRITNAYFSPLATKPQALGFGLFFLKELEDKPASIIFPFSKRYSRETSKGVGRSWVYPIVL